ncbi:MAG: hypothetical protein AB8B61_09120 [Cyclobacteriaceae bacterium]
MKAYTPISCDFHSIIEHYATLGSTVVLIYRTEEKEQHTVNCTIIDVFTSSREEFITTNQGQIIRLDQIIQLNDSIAPADNQCAI